MNRCVEGGLVLTNRLQLIKQGVHDQTTLTPINHSLVVDDRQDGTYHLVLTAAMVCSMRLVVNLDKNLPNNGGELPGITVHLVLDPEKPSSARGDEKSASPQRSGLGDASSAGIGDPRHSASFSKRRRASISMGSSSDLLRGMRAVAPLPVSADRGDSPGSSARSSATSSARGQSERLRNAATEMMLGFGMVDERRSKDALVVAAEAFAAGSHGFEFDQQLADTERAGLPNPQLFDRASSSASSIFSAAAPSPKPSKSNRRASLSL